MDVKIFPRNLSLFLGAPPAEMMVSLLLHTTERVVAIVEVMEVATVAATMVMEVTEEGAAKEVTTKIIFWV